MHHSFLKKYILGERGAHKLEYWTPHPDIQGSNCGEALNYILGECTFLSQFIVTCNTKEAVVLSQHDLKMIDWNVDMPCKRRFLFFFKQSNSAEQISM